MLTTDIKQVEWYAAQYRAWGVAVYFEKRLEQVKRSP